ncbi:hypothetical protein FBY06_11589 [Pseudomonas sp. SJZ085]|uniref:hypothetical protein n=1 Tax=unclassified Pseudomonas TaxID=196821 RepID=UPI001198D77D|nr:MULTISPECIES: hypothetical protein [unclassified Pseudomonas]TWC18164.1 hypothetical protein FBX99_11589 [Pseudomonas sp. SJZ074]TWC36136.1 hypothetical protein FBY06_11589 [Pseudomonas sp. SJZ085]
MKNKTVTLDRELVERAVMRPGKESLAVNNADIIARGRAQAEIRELLAAEPVPPAGGEPEVHRYQVVKMLSEDGNKIDYKPHGPWVVMADAHDAHVARLQAEVARLKLGWAGSRDSYQKLMHEKLALQSELTKARGLFEAILNDPRLVVAMPSDLIGNAKALLAHQSAPAAKAFGFSVVEDPTLTLGEIKLVQAPDYFKCMKGE